MENEIKTSENITLTVPYIVHEGEMARMERLVKRLWIALRVRRKKSSKSVKVRVRKATKRKPRK